MTDLLCTAPWRGLHITPQGDVKTCCAGARMVGNINSEPIDQILNNSVMTEIRQCISQGQLHDKYCQSCIQDEKFGTDSERHWHNRINSNFDYSAAGNQYHYPTLVDVRWNITCNLSCNYCNESFSSKWAAIKNMSTKTGIRSYYEQVCDFIEQHREQVHDVALVGGEPLLLPENERLLDAIPDSATVTIITNLSVDLENNKVFCKLKNRSRVGWSVSFENVQQRFEYVRHGSNWQLLQKNLGILKNLRHTQGHWEGIHAVYNMYNITRLCELYQFAQDRDFTVLWHSMTFPDYLNPLLHGPKVAELAIKEIENFYAMGVATAAEHAFFDKMLDAYRSITQAKPGIEQKFKQHLGTTENLYHPDKQGHFCQLWPELAFLMT